MSPSPDDRHAFYDHVRLLYICISRLVAAGYPVRHDVVLRDIWIIFPRSCPSYAGIAAALELFLVESH